MIDTPPLSNAPPHRDRQFRVRADLARNVANLQLRQRTFLKPREGNKLMNTVYCMERGTVFTTSLLTKDEQRRIDPEPQ